MAQTKTKRNRPRKSERASARALPRRAYRLRRHVSIAGALLLSVLVAAASIYPKQAETIVPKSQRIDVFALVRALTATATEFRHKLNPQMAVTANVDSPALEPLLRSVSPPNRISEPVPDSMTFGAMNPKLAGTLHTVSIEATQTQLYGSPVDPRLQLVSLDPPYTLSGPGSYQTRVAHVSGTIDRSLFEAGLSVGLSDRLILSLTEIFGWDIDFALDVRTGDSFSVIYEEKYWLGRKIDDGPILAAEFVNNGRAYRAIGMRAQSGQLRYYTPTGRSLRQAFLRTPVKFSRVSSGYSDTRYHPILKLWRAHTGIDYAAPAGTPVRATASGTIMLIGWNGGYGRTIEIDHGNTYSTLYAHLSRYRSDLHAGSHVEQGDVIGYVGSSGLATGSHLHYEFRVNGEHRNPLAYQSPDSELIGASKRAEFLRTSQVWAVELDRMSKRYLASR
jgi:murein DD-endopeptidase MepM/ murein hydrolase activator NlpD